MSVELGSLPIGARFKAGALARVAECACEFSRGEDRDGSVIVNIEYLCRNHASGHLGPRGGWVLNWDPAWLVAYDPLAHALASTFGGEGAPP